VRTSLIAATLAVALAAPGLAFTGRVDREGNLDGDVATELVYTARVDLSGVADEFDPTEVRVGDSCGSIPIDRRIAGPQDNLVTLKLRRIDTRRGAEVFVDMRSGAAARQGEARVVAWRRRSGTPCRRARNLFKYKSTNPTRRPSGTTGEVSGFQVKVRERARRYRGKEVVLAEFFLVEGEPLCCGSVKKVTWWRYSRGGDRYVRYRTKIRR